MSDPVGTVYAHWGEKPPNWVLRLASECAASSQRKVAEQLDRSGGLVNQVLHNKYPGNLAAIQQRVEGVFMAGTIECPALSSIPANICQDWRAKARVFSSANPLRVQMFRACKKCPINGGRNV